MVGSVFINKNLRRVRGRRNRIFDRWLLTAHRGHKPEYLCIRVDQTETVRIDSKSSIRVQLCKIWKPIRCRYQTKKAAKFDYLEVGNVWARSVNFKEIDGDDCVVACWDSPPIIMERQRLFGYWWDLEVEARFSRSEE